MKKRILVLRSTPVEGSEPRASEVVLELREALAAVMELIDSGVLVRDTSKDREPDWSIRQIPLLMALKKAKEALAKAGKVSE